MSHQHRFYWNYDRNEIECSCGAYMTAANYYSNNGKRPAEIVYPLLKD